VLPAASTAAAAAAAVPAPSPPAPPPPPPTLLSGPAPKTVVRVGPGRGGEGEGLYEGEGGAFSAFKKILLLSFLFAVPSLAAMPDPGRVPDAGGLGALLLEVAGPAACVCALVHVCLHMYVHTRTCTPITFQACTHNAAMQ
jgi:hypothetical protein